MNMAEKLVDVVANLSQRGKKDQPPKLLCNINMVLKHPYPFLFFFENSKNLGRSDNAQRRKWPYMLDHRIRDLLSHYKKGVIFRA